MCCHPHTKCDLCFWFLDRSKLSDARQSDQFIKTTKEIAEFVGRTYKYGGDIRLCVETLTIPIMTPPLDYKEGAGRTAIRIWEKSVDEQVRRMLQLTENIKALYSLVWEQCSDVVRQKAESHDLFKATSAAGNGLALLTILKGISFHFQSLKYVGHSIHEALKRYYNLLARPFCYHTGIHGALSKHRRRGHSQWRVYQWTPWTQEDYYA
jgi:hypothetical protein